MVSNMVQRYLSKFLINSLGQTPEKKLWNQRKRTLKRNIWSKWHCQVNIQKGSAKGLLPSMGVRSLNRPHTVFSLRNKIFVSWGCGKCHLIIALICIYFHTIEVEHSHMFNNRICPLWIIYLHPLAFMSFNEFLCIWAVLRLCQIHCVQFS